MQPSEGQIKQRQIFELEELCREVTNVQLYAAEPNVHYLRDVIQRMLLVLTKGL